MENSYSCSCKGVIAFGPWGYNNIGNEWTYSPKQSAGIKQIIVRYGEIIDSLTFKGISGGDRSSKFGGDGGDRTVKIEIDFPSEYVTGISGTHRWHWIFGDNISSLVFHTNKSDYGPFGSRNGAAFSANASGGVVTGFHGRACRYLRSIGVYVMPLCSLSTEAPKEKVLPESGSCSSVPLPFLPPPRSAAAIGGAGGREWDDGVFSAVKGVHVRVRVDTGVVSAVRFIYLKKDGSDFVSPFHGGYCGVETLRKTIMLSEEGEYLIGVEGFYGEVEGMNVIKSLSFITNKAKYGPMGAEIGMHLSSVNGGDLNRKVVGFHGRSGAYLDAIGMHTRFLKINSYACSCCTALHCTKL